MTPHSTSRGIMYTAPPKEATDETAEPADD